MMMLSKIKSILSPNPNRDASSGAASASADSNRPVLVPTSKIVIVGSGCFGISTAFHLLQRGYKDVTVLERATELPAPDSASSDINKVVRSAYEDGFYTRLAREAIEAWKDHEVWSDNYHESGVLVCGTDGRSLFADKSFQNDHRSGARVKAVVTSTSTGIPEAGGTANGSNDEELESIGFSEVFHSEIPLGRNITRPHGYLNADGGWVYSKGAVERAMELVKNLGGQIIPGKEVSSLIKLESRTRGVKCKDGSEFPADIVVLATGCWTASAFPDLDLGKRAFATGQSIVTVQLTPEEGERYRNIPVILDLHPSGFYCFPPNEDNLLKMGCHNGGVANLVPIPDASSVDAVGSSISTPRTILTHGCEGLKIPKSDAAYLRECFQHIFPDLATKPLHGTRLCWYTDSPDSNWIIDVHPNDPGLALVTAGSGHGFKFLPVIGRLAVDRLEGKMDEATMRRFAIDRQFDEQSSYREGAVINPLNAEELIGPEVDG